MKRRGPDLAERLGALERAAELARGRLGEPTLSAAVAVVERARPRLTHGSEWTVVALAGATGSGKSSVFNALAGEPLSEVSVRRPTTGAAHACVWGEASAEGLLEWLGVSRIHRKGTPDPTLDGLVLLDLPDHDSVRLENRLEMGRLVGLVDQLVWVVDPEKYADAALHDGFLVPLAGYADVMLFVMNQIDRLSDQEVRACLRDFAALLESDGLGRVPIVATSARDGLGLDELRNRLAERVAEKRAAVRRIEADLGDVVDAMRAEATLGGEARPPDRKARARLAQLLTDAAGGATLVDAVARGYRRDAGLAVGWPVTRWLSRLRAHPLRRLGIRAGREKAATSLPRPGRASLADIRQGLRALADETSRGLDGPWPARLREVVVGEPDRLVDPLDRALASARLGAARVPAWWGALGALQWVLLATAVGGLAGLAVLFGFAWFRLTEPPTPQWRGVPWPTLMALGGVGGGWIAAGVGRLLARVGGRRRAKRAEAQLVAGVGEVVDREVIGPLEAELAARSELADSLKVAAG